MKKFTQFTGTIALLCLAGMINAASINVKIYGVSKSNSDKYLGSVKMTDSQYGLLITPDLHNLTPGLHGFHVHVKPSCADHGMAAGGHLDPTKTGKHLGPYNPNGHLGDLPVLYVTKDGSATVTTLAPRLTVKDIKNHSLMIHQDGDNYSDTPKKLGGGGARVACGVIR